MFLRKAKTYYLILSLHIKVMTLWIVVQLLAAIGPQHKIRMILKHKMLWRREAETVFEFIIQIVTASEHINEIFLCGCFMDTMNATII